MKLLLPPLLHCYVISLLSYIHYLTTIIKGFSEQVNMGYGSYDFKVIQLIRGFF